MKWIAKAMLQKALSALPHGEKYNYWFQRNTGGLPVSEEEFVEKVRLAHERIIRWERFGTKPLDQIQCFEFGAGWDLIGPLAYWSFGVERQIVIDIRPNLRPELLRDSIEKFKRCRAACEAITGRSLRSMEGKTLNDKNDLMREFGIQYLAPLDAAKTGLPSGSIDFISTNSTFEHIRASTLPAILTESKRLMAADGVQCHFIDMKDHFSYFDRSISKYHFLTHSNFSWSFLNSALAYQNRLRYADYLQLFKDAGLHLAEEDVEWATEEDIQTFRALKLARRFAKTDSDERLSAHIIRVVLKA